MSFEASWRCQETVIRFTSHFDAGEHAAMEDYFAPDGVWRRADGDVVGLEQLRAFLARRGTALLARHLLSNLRTTVHANDRATVDSYVTAYRAVAPAAPGTAVALGLPFLLGRYRDELVLEAGQWRIARRELVVDFQG